MSSVLEIVHIKSSTMNNPFTSPVRQELSSVTGQVIRIADSVEFQGPVKFEELSETPLEFTKTGDTTPTVLNLERIKFQNTSPVTVTNFDNGREGQYIIVVGDGQTIVQHGTNIFNTAGANITLINNRVYAYVRVQGVWREQGGTPVPTLAFTSATRTSNVTLINSGVWYDVFSLSLAAGVWLLNTSVQFQHTTNGEVLYGLRISDGTNHFASGQKFAHNKNPNSGILNLTSLITLASTTTVLTQAITDTGGSSVTVRAATSLYPSGDTASQINAVRIG